MQSPTFAQRLIGTLMVSAALCGAGASAAPKPAAPSRAAKPVVEVPAAKPASETGSRGAFTFAIAPAPKWVVPAAEQPGAVTERAPLSYRVIDEQTRLVDRTATTYTHVVRVVNESGGLSTGAQVEIEFDPTFQTLTFHHFDIARGGKRLNRLDRGKIQLLQRETQLERRMYDGRVTASVVVDDVRVGDEIDFAYSIDGRNPVFDGRFSELAWMASFRGPVALYQVRLIAPESRPIRHRLGAPDMKVQTQVDKGLRETVVRRKNVAQLRGDAGTPFSAVIRQMVQFSEYGDWSDVAQWGHALFALGPVPSAIERKAAEIAAAAGPDRSRRLVAALEFVQRDVRYFGSEIGPNTHRPAAPDKVLEQRFGDCKDKVALFIALLRQLDIPAEPVLVSTLLRGQVQSMLPSPLAFDHVIARVELDGQAHHLDATRGHQTGTLANRGSVGFERGLPLAAGIGQLASLPTAYDQVRMSVQDTFRVDRFAEGATLESRITYRGDLAELVRESLATRNTAELESQVAQPYARYYPNVKSRGPMRVERSESDDAVTLVQSFTLDDPWRYPDQRLLTFEFVQWSLIDAIRVPGDPSRRDAYAIGYPGLYRHTVALEFAEDVFTTPGSQRAEDGDARVKLRTRTETAARRAELSGEAQLQFDEIAPADWGGHVAVVTRLASRAGTTVSIPAMPPAMFEVLRKELKDLEDAARANKIKVRTQVQFQSLARSKVLTSHLDAGRLPARLRAQALVARGVQYDNIGRFDDARKDFDRALELAPESPESLNPAAVNALQLRDYPRVIALVDKVLARNPGDPEARNLRALGSYFAQDYAAARADFDELLKDPAQVRRGFPIVWQSIVSRRIDGKAAQAPAAFAQEQLPGEWPRPLVDWALGRADDAAVIAAAKAGSGSRERLCEAYFYIAERHLADGNTKRAREFFQLAVEQGITEFIEDGSARNRLASLPR